MLRKFAGVGEEAWKTAGMAELSMTAKSSRVNPDLG